MRDTNPSLTRRVVIQVTYFRTVPRCSISRFGNLRIRVKSNESREIWPFGDCGFQDILPFVKVRQELPETTPDRNSRHFGTIDALR